MTSSSAEQGPVAKVAGLKKLKTGSTHDRQVLGAELSSYGVSENVLVVLNGCAVCNKKASQNVNQDVYRMTLEHLRNI